VVETIFEWIIPRFWHSGIVVFRWRKPVIANRKFEGRECEVKQSVGEKLRMKGIHRIALLIYGLLLFVPSRSLRDYNRNGGYRRLEHRSTSKNRYKENRVFGHSGIAVFRWWTPVIANGKFEGRECEVKQSVGEKLRMKISHRMALRLYGLLLSSLRYRFVTTIAMTVVEDWSFVQLLKTATKKTAFLSIMD